MTKIVSILNIKIFSYFYSNIWNKKVELGGSIYGEHYIRLIIYYSPEIHFYFIAI